MKTTFNIRVYSDINLLYLINSVRLKTTVHLLRLHLHSFFTETVVGRLKNDFTCHEF